MFIFQFVVTPREIPRVFPLFKANNILFSQAISPVCFDNDAAQSRDKISRIARARETKRITVIRESFSYLFTNQ